MNQAKEAISEKEYLKKYNPKAFDNPIFTLDNVLFSLERKSLSVEKSELKVLLVKRNNHPYKNLWGLPGGFVDINKDDTLNKSTQRIITEKTGIKVRYLYQVNCLGNLKRDPRGWSVSLSFFSLIPSEECQPKINSVSEAKWFTLKEIKKLSLAFDHIAIIKAGQKALIQKAKDSLICAHALKPPFTLPELLAVHEVILNKPLQYKSFKRRIDNAQVLDETELKKASGKRKAQLYKIRKGLNDYTFERGLG